MNSNKFTKSADCLMTVLVQLLIVAGWILVNAAEVQYGLGMSQDGPARMAPIVFSSYGVNRPRLSWDNVDQAMLDKCLQMETVTLKKRHLGLEIPDILLNNGANAERRNSLKRLRDLMVENGK